MTKKTTNLVQDLRKLSPAEIDKKLTELRAERLTLRSQLAIAKLKNYAKFNQLRKEIARLETIKHEKMILSLTNNE